MNALTLIQATVEPRAPWRLADLFKAAELADSEQTNGFEIHGLGRFYVEKIDKQEAFITVYANNHNQNIELSRHGAKIGEDSDDGSYGPMVPGGQRGLLQFFTGHVSAAGFVRGFTAMINKHKEHL